jgi:hypothetical protein
MNARTGTIQHSFILNNLLTLIWIKKERMLAAIEQKFDRAQTRRSHFGTRGFGSRRDTKRSSARGVGKEAKVKAGQVPAPK